MLDPPSMDNPFKGHGPVFLILSLFLSGVPAGLALGAAWPAVALPVAGAATVLLAIRRLPRLAGLLVAFACGLLSAAALPLVAPSATSSFQEVEVLLSANIEDARSTDDGIAGIATEAVIRRVDGKAGTLRLSRIALRVRGADQPVPFPAEVRAYGRIRPMTGASNLHGGLPREVRAMGQGVQYSFDANAARTVFLPVADAAASPFAMARRRIGDFLDRHAGRDDGALYLRSLTTGEVPAPSHPLTILLRQTGLAHLLAISGVNVAIFHMAGAVLFRVLLVLAFGRRGNFDFARWALLLALPLSWMYVLTAGAPVPAVRSASAITIGTACWLWRGVHAAPLAWTATVFLTLAIDSLLILSPSFLLSFGATFFLVVSFAGRGVGRSRGDSIPKRAGAWLSEGLTAATVAFAGTLPFTVLFFGTVPLLSVLWNLLFGPILGTIGVLGAFLAAVGGAFGIDFLGVPTGWISRFLSLSLRLLGMLSMNGAGFVPTPPPGVGTTVVFVCLSVSAAVMARCRNRSPVIPVSAAAVIFLGWIHLPFAALPPAESTFRTLDVGKGTAMLVSFKGGGNVLVDTGSASQGDAGNRVVVPHLRAEGIGSIDLLILSHPHEDHFGGTAAVLSAMDVGEIWIPDGTDPVEYGDAVVLFAGPIRKVRTGERWVASSGEVEVLRAPTTRSVTEGGNGLSLVLRLRSKGLEVFMPGDFEGGAEAAGITEVDAGRFRCLVLPHHGSKGADPTGWIRRTDPNAVLTQRTHCFTGDNLVNIGGVFSLSDGSFFVRTDGGRLVYGQEGGTGLLRFLWQLI